MNLNLQKTPFVNVTDVKIPDVFYRRMKTGIEELDALFGDGILPGSATTITARAGLGKTTLMLQMLEGIAKSGKRIGYCSSEESVEQIAMTCQRLNLKNIHLCNENRVNVISNYMKHLDVLVIDSFQGLEASDHSGRALEKYCVEKLVKRAKETECAVFLICHNTKTGTIKGSSLILHAVDVTMSIEPIKDAEANARRIVATKNRFGPAIDIECFIEYSGYNFSTVVHDDDESAPKSTKNDIKKQILQMDDINLQAVIKKFNVDATKAGWLLRELVLENKLTKEGRGGKAVYNKLYIDVVESSDEVSS